MKFGATPPQSKKKPKHRLSTPAVALLTMKGLASNKLRAVLVTVGSAVAILGLAVALALENGVSLQFAIFSVFFAIYFVKILLYTNGI